MTENSDKCPACGSVSPSEKSAAQRVIERFGSVKKLSSATGINIDAIYRWDYTKDKGGCDGRIPSVHHQKILKAAEELEIELRPEELVNV